MSARGRELDPDRGMDGPEGEVEAEAEGEAAPAPYAFEPMGATRANQVVAAFARAYGLPCGLTRAGAGWTMTVPAEWHERQMIHLGLIKRGGR